LVAKTRRRLISITLCNPDFFIFKRDTNSKPMLPVAEGKADHLHRILVCAEIALDAPKEGIQLFFSAMFAYRRTRTEEHTAGHGDSAADTES